MSRLARAVSHKKQRIIRILDRAPYVGEMVESEVLYGLVNGKMSSYVKHRGKIYRTAGSIFSSNSLSGDTTTDIEGDDLLATGIIDGKVLTADGSNGAAWENVPEGGNPDGTDVLADGIADGKMLAASGSGTSVWEYPQGVMVRASGIPSGKVLTSPGSAAGCTWENSGVTEGTSVLSTGVGSGYVLTADGDTSCSWQEVSGGGGGSGDIESVTLTADDSGTASAITGAVNLTVTGGLAIGTTATGTTLTINHDDTSSQGSVNNSGQTFVQDITLDDYGHITAITSNVASGGGGGGGDGSGALFDGGARATGASEFDGGARV